MLLLFSVSKIPFGAFRQIFAVCCAHNLFAVSEQIPHLQPEKYFPSGTRPDEKCFRSCFSLTRKILRSFFYSLKRRSECSSFCNILNIYSMNLSDMDPSM